MMINLDITAMKYSFLKLRVKIIAIAVVTFAAASLSSCAEKEEKVELDVYENLREVNRLELAHMTVGKVGMVADPEWDDMKTLEGKARVLWNSMKVGKRIGVYSYDTYVTAYVDLSKLQPEDIVVNREAGTVDIVLPPVEIMTDGREPQLHEVHYRVTGFRSRIRPEERAALKAQMAKEVRRELATSRVGMEKLRKNAEDKARAWMVSLAENWDLAAHVEFRSGS